MLDSCLCFSLYCVYGVVVYLFFTLVVLSLGDE